MTPPDDWDALEQWLSVWAPREHKDTFARLREREAQLLEDLNQRTWKAEARETQLGVESGEMEARWTTAEARVAELERERDNAVYERDLHVAAGIAAEAVVEAAREIQPMSDPKASYVAQMIPDDAVIRLSLALAALDMKEEQAVGTSTSL